MPTPPDSLPDDAGALDYQLNWNDRFDSGEPVHLHWFDYRDRPSTPADDQAPQLPSGTR